MDYIEPVPFLVIMAILVAIWLALGIRDRRRALRAEARLMVDRHRAYVHNGRCGAVWDDGDIHWCDLRAEHDGPHLDQPTGALRFLDESFIGGPGIRLHVRR